MTRSTPRRGMLTSILPGPRGLQGRLTGLGLATAARSPAALEPPGLMSMWVALAFMQPAGWSSASTSSV